MPDYKKQHFLPQFYFRFFSWNEINIGMFNINNNSFLKSVLIKKQCQKDYFYGKDEKFEKYLKNIEDKSAPILKKLINTQKIGDEENIYSNLLPFLIIQHARTKFSSDLYQELGSKLLTSLAKEYLKYSKSNIKSKNIDDVKITTKNSPILLLKDSIMSIPLLIDLKAKLFINKTSNNFIFSDNPVVLYNSHFYNKKFSNIGYCCRGLEIIFPVSPHLLLIFFDDYCYKIGDYNQTEIEINKIQDVNELNKLQFLSADSCIYFDNGFTKDQIVNYWDSIKKYKFNNKTKLIKSDKIKNSNEIRQLIGVSVNDISYRINLSVIKIYSRVLTCRSLKNYRNPQLISDFTNFTKEVDKGNYKPFEFNIFIKEKYNK